MTELIRAKEPFRFYTRLHLSELTGLQAANLTDLVDLIKNVSGACIYHHTHRFLQQHKYLSPEPPNDFAYWVTKTLGENELGEMLASIDIVQFPTIRDLREKIVKTIEDYLQTDPAAKLRFAHPGTEFHFIKSVSFIFPTEHLAYDLKEFADILKDTTIDSLYYHIFEARLRLEKGDNDFSYWIETFIGDVELADNISKLDPYTYTLEDLRKTVIGIIEKRISQ
jgi:hypothetical protein